MAWISNQNTIKNFRYLSVLDAEGDSVNAKNSDTCFVFENKNNYYYEDGNTDTVDWYNVLNANGGSGRWIIAGASWHTPEKIVVWMNGQTIFSLTTPVFLPWDRMMLSVNWLIVTKDVDYRFNSSNELEWLGNYNLNPSYKLVLYYF